MPPERTAPPDHVDRAQPSATGQTSDDFYLSLEGQAYDAVVRDYNVVKVPYYFLDRWVPLMGASAALLTIAFRQLAFVSRCKEDLGEIPMRATLRDLSRWCGQSFQHVRRLMDKAAYLPWFVRAPDGPLGAHFGKRSETPKYLVRIEIPLVPDDQARLWNYLAARAPKDDEGWLGLLHRALAAKEDALDPDAARPSAPSSIHEMVRQLRDASQPLTPEIDLACVELHKRWVGTNFSLISHYFLRTWLPDLTPGLGLLVAWARRRAQSPGSAHASGSVRFPGWNTLAKAIGVSTKTVQRWLTDQSAYPHTSSFLTLTESIAGAGVVEVRASDDWRIAGRSVRITPQTEIEGAVEEGDFVHVTGVAGDDGTLIAERIDLANWSNDERGFSRDLSFEVRLSEPIHPKDQKRYETLLAEGMPDVGGQLTSPEGGQAGPLGHWTYSDKEWTNRDKGTKGDNRAGTESDKDRIKGDNLGPRNDRPTSKDDKGWTRGDRGGAKGDPIGKKSDALRGSEENPEDLIPRGVKRRPTAGSADEGSESSPDVVAVTDTHWDIDHILTESAVTGRHRRAVLAGWPSNQTPFIAWLLWGLSAADIFAPALHAAKRLQQGDPPPKAFLRLAQVPAGRLARWLRDGDDEVPHDLIPVLQELRENGALERLVSLSGMISEVVRAREAEGDGAGRREGESPPWGGPDETCDTVVTVDGTTAKRVWASALGQLQIQAPRASFETWIRGSELIHYDAGEFVVGVQNPYARDWLDDRLKSAVQRVLTGIAGRSIRVRFVVCEALSG